MLLLGGGEDLLLLLRANFREIRELLLRLLNVYIWAEVLNKIVLKSDCRRLEFAIVCIVNEIFNFFADLYCPENIWNSLSDIVGT